MRVDPDSFNTTKEHHKRDSDYEPTRFGWREGMDGHLRRNEDLTHVKMNFSLHGTSLFSLEVVIERF